jgi:hypothetical protein
MLPNCSRRFAVEHYLYSVLGEDAEQVFFYRTKE